MKYKFLDEIYENVEELRTAIEDEAYGDRDEFDDWMDDSYDEVDVMGYCWSPSYALKELDEGAYDYEFSIWLDSKLEDIISEVERSSGWSDVSTTWGDIEIIDDEEDDDEDE